MIQNVKTRWNNIYFMFEKTYSLREYITIWLKKEFYNFRLLIFNKIKWKQIKFFLNILHSFQQMIDFVNFINSATIHIVWIIYNAMHVHFERQIAKCKILKMSWSKFFLRFAFLTIQNKLRNYYDATTNKTKLFFNLNICFNSNNKLNYYNVNCFFKLINFFLLWMIFY